MVPVFDHAGVHPVAGNEPGADHRKANRVIQVLGAQGLGEADQPGLRGGVGLIERGPDLARHRSDEDDVTTSALEHPGCEAMREQQRRRQVDVHHRGQFLARVARERADRLDPCVVDEQVDRAEGGFDAVYERVRDAQVREVGRYGEGLHAKLDISSAATVSRASSRRPETAMFMPSRARRRARCVPSPPRRRSRALYGLAGSSWRAPLVGFVPEIRP